MRVPNDDASKRVIGPIADGPDSSAAQKRSVPIPVGATIPMPVTTTDRCPAIWIRLSTRERCGTPSTGSALFRELLARASGARTCELMNVVCNAPETVQPEHLEKIEG